MDSLLHALSSITHGSCGLDHFPLGKREVCHELCCVLQDQLILYRVRKEMEGGRRRKKGKKRDSGNMVESRGGEGGG